MGPVRVIGLTWVLALSCACGESQVTQEAPALPIEAMEMAAMERLVPTDAVAIVAGHSLAELDQAIIDAAQSSQLGLTVASHLLRQLPGWPREIYLDLNRPFLIAIRPMKGLSWPAPVLILPVSSVPLAETFEPGLTLCVDGDYIGVSADKDYVAGGVPSALAASLPAGHIVARARLGELLAPLRPMVMGMAAMVAASQPNTMAGPEAAAMSSASVRMVFDTMEAIPSVEAGLTLANGHIVLDGTFAVSEDSALANIPPARCDTLDDMVGWLDGDAPIHMVTAMDAGAYAKVMADWMLGTPGMWPEASEDALMEYLATIQVLGSRCGYVFAGDMDFTEDGMELAYQFEAQDPNGMVELMSQLTLANYKLAGGPTTQIDSTMEGGWAVAEASVDMNSSLDQLALAGSMEGASAAKMMRSMYGGDGVMRMSTRASAERVIMTIGGQDPAHSADGRPLRGGSPPQAIADALTRLEGADTRIAMHLDYISLFGSMASFMGDVPGMEQLPLERLADADPVSMSLWTGGKGTHWTFGMDFDLDALGEVIRSFDRR